jgi:hypothetical protein
MSAPLLWDDNPARKYFDILLATYWGYTLVMHKRYQYKSFGREERVHLRKEIEKLPNSPLKELLLSILKVIQAPTGSFKIKSFKLKDDGDKLVHTHEIMADLHVFFRIAGLSWLNTPSVEIFTNLKHHSINMIYKEKHIARFLYQHWNVGAQQGYSIKRRNALIYHLRASDSLRRAFRPIAEGAWSDLKPLEFAKIYDIPLRQPQIRALNSQTIQNGRIALFEDSKGINTTESDHLSTKFLESTLKIQSDLSDHDDKEGNGSGPEDFLSFGDFGGVDD